MTIDLDYIKLDSFMDVVSLAPFFLTLGSVFLGITIISMIIENNNCVIMEEDRVKSYFAFCWLWTVIILISFYGFLCLSSIKNDKYIIGEDEEVVTTIKSFDEKVSGGKTEYYNFSYNQTPLTENENFKDTLESSPNNIYESVDDTGYITEHIQHRKLLFLKTNIYTYRIYLPTEYYEKIHGVTDTVNLP